MNIFLRIIHYELTKFNIFFFLNYQYLKFTNFQNSVKLIKIESEMIKIKILTIYIFFNYYIFTAEYEKNKTSMRFFYFK